MALVFQISLTALIIFSGIVLAISEGGPIPAATGPIALATLYFVDWRRLWKLSQTTLSGLALAAFAAAGFEYVFGGIDAPLVAAGHLLTYLTWMLLANRKQNSVYRMLLALSVLQISLAVFLSSQVWMGVGLVIYMLLAIWTLSVLLLYQSLHLPAGGPIPAGSDAGSTRNSGIKSRNGIARQLRDVHLTGSFLRGDIALAAFSLLIAVTLFLFIPRLWLSAAVPGQQDTGDSITGFTATVRMGDLGEILESNAPAMTVKLFRAIDDRPLTEEEYNAYLGPTPLFRGAVMDSYEGGFWQRRHRSEQMNYTANKANRGEVRQQIMLLPTGTELLFTSGDVVSVDVDPYRSASRLELSDEFIYLRFAGAQSSLTYNVFTTQQPRDTDFSRLREDSLRLNEALTDPALLRRGISPRYADRLRAYQDACLRVPSRMGRTRELSQTLTVGSASPAEAAQKILSHLQDGERYAYSLQLAVIDAGIDPVEDFLFNRRQGHCEYFAASMVMMLRCAGIPSRLVTGFKGGFYSPDLQIFQVQQLHAHAWAEAYLDGHWVTFDPTPLARDISVSAQQSADSGTKLTSAWMWMWLVRYSRYEQASQIYEPIEQAARFAWELIVDLFRGKGEKLSQLLDFLTSPSRWLSWSGAFLLLAVSSLVGGLVWIVRRLRRVRTILESLMRQLDLTGNARPVRVPFFERFTEIVNARGLVRRPEQTAGEFAQDAWQLLSIHAPAAAQALSSRELAAAFNVIRFGGQALPDPQLRRMDAWLQQLEAMWPIKRTGK